MKRSLLVLMFVMLSVVVASAQGDGFSFSIVAGPNFSYLANKETKSGVMTGGEVGFLVRTNTDKPVFCETGLSVSYQGATFEAEGDYDFYEILDITYHMVYLKLPVTMAFRTKISNKVNIVSSVGLYGGLNVMAKRALEMGNSSEWGVQTTNIGSEVGFFDCGMRFGLAMNVSRFRVGVSYDQGFVNIIEGSEIKNRVTSVNIGVNF